MAARKKSSSRRKYGKSASKSVKRAMHKRKKGTLKSGKGGKGGKVKSRKQAIAIGLSEARRKGKKVPPRKTGTKRKSATSAKRKSSAGSKRKSSGTKRKSATKSKRKSSRKSKK